MEANGGDGMNNNTVRKKRSLTFRRRRPRPEGSNLVTPSDNLSKISSDDIPAFDTNPTRKEFSLSHCISRADSIAESQRGQREITSRNKRSTEGVLSPASWKSTTSREDEGNGRINGLEGETKRLKLKISGGVSRLLVHANGLSRKSSKPVNDTTNNDLEPSGSLRKSKRAPKKRVFDNDDDSDEEIRYLEKLKYRSVSVCNEETASERRELKPSKKTASEKVSEEMEYEEELDSVADEKEIGNEVKRETALTSRQRALACASGKPSAIEFPDGLPPTTSRRKKENLSAMEQQLKKAEAAQRRKVQVEKAARESEAEAIRKILGQDSGRKKREDKIKKRLDEMAQEKAAHEERASTSYIRTIMGPNGTTVSFPIDKVPSLFDPKPSGYYPPPRENCVGPLCTNPYKYRDSKTKLPLCSLKCYKAVQGQQQQQTTPV